MKFVLFFLLSVFLVTSCARLVKSLGLEKKEQRLKPTYSLTPIRCESTSPYSAALVGASSDAQNSFKEFIKNLASKQSIDFEDQVVFWALFQMKVRPHFASPTSRLQFMSRTKHGTRYWDFTSNEKNEDGIYPYFHGLTSFLKGHNKKKSLLWYADLLDQHFNNGLTIDRALEDNLELLKESIGTDATLRQFWFRGEELLRQGERVPVVKLTALIKSWLQSSQPLTTAPPFFSYRRTPTLDVSCNYDLTLYDNSIFLIDKEENRGHLFGISLGSQAFLAVASQNTSPPASLAGTPLFKGSAKVRSTAFCVVQRPEGEVWLAANQSRDPGQHMYHLFRYGLGNVKEPKDLERLLRHARHMFLSDPLRLIIESSRSRDNQVRELLKLNVPIYNATSIGNIWAWARFGDNGGGFFIDDRNPGTLLCSP